MSAETSRARTGLFYDLRSMPPLNFDDVPPEEPEWLSCEDLALEAAASQEAWAALERVLLAGEAALAAATNGAPAPAPAPAAAATSAAAAAEPDAAAVRARRLAAPGVARPVVPSASDALLDELAAVLDRIGAAGPTGSRSAVSRLGRLAERSRGLFHAEVAEMDALGTHTLEGGIKSSTSSFVRDALHLSGSAARATARLSVDLRDRVPAVGQALRDGELTVEHARAVTLGIRGLEQDVVTDCEASILMLGKADDPVGVASKLRNHAIAIDERLADEAARRARDRAECTMSPVGDRYVSKGNHDAESGTIIRTALDLAVERLREAGDDRPKAARREEVLRSWAERELDQHSDPDSAADLSGDVHGSRTHVHIAATASQLEGAAHTLVPHPTDQGRLVVAPCDRDRAGLTYAEALQRTLNGERDLSPTFMDTGRALGRGALRRLLCDATVSLVVLPDPLTSHPTELADCHCGEGVTDPDPDPDPDADLEHVACTCAAGIDLTSGLDPEELAALQSSLGPAESDQLTPQAPPRLDQARVNPLWVGRSARTVPKQLWQALVWRDRTCIVKGCKKPASGCAAHHVRHWLDGGTTDLGNMVLLCHEHHHAHHDRKQDLPHHDGKRWLTQLGWRWFTPQGWAYLDPELAHP